jgi:hypothetical protein
MSDVDPVTRLGGSTCRSSCSSARATLLERLGIAT